MAVHIPWALILEDLRWPHSAQTRPARWMAWLNMLVAQIFAAKQLRYCKYPWVRTLYTLHLADMEHFGKIFIWRKHTFWNLFCHFGSLFTVMHTKITCWKNMKSFLKKKNMLPQPTKTQLPPKQTPNHPVVVFSQKRNRGEQVPSASFPSWQTSRPPTFRESGVFRQFST